MSDPDEVQSFQEAWCDPDLRAREKLQEAIHLEFKKMFDMDVWRHVKRRAHPQDCRLVGCRWVFKVRRNGVYDARLVAKGFTQMPGVDFADNYSPVVNDVWSNTPVMSNFSTCDSHSFTTATQSLDLLHEIACCDKTL